MLFMIPAHGGEPAAHEYTNRLIREKSPYLLQHAHNPVNWYAWGVEAFEKARQEGKPIFLSIGYSTCHWCHVMEKESFENPELAGILNQNFVSIKVDREERPDLDTIYMDYVIAVTGRGGWPMSVFLTHDGKPFYGGTYYPPKGRMGIPGFGEILNSIADGWKNRPEEILKSADSAVLYLKDQKIKPAQNDLTESVLEKAARHYKDRFDSLWGGFSPAPKFPMGHSLSFLLRSYSRFAEPELLEMAERTLQKMAEGGVYDQIGGGFHRYSTDREWFLPHFEKMLYDQALLAAAYLDGYQLTQNELYARTARGILDYVLREMTGAEGGFFSAQDADSVDPEEPGEKKEGAFYVWRETHIKSVLPKEQAEIFCFYYGVKADGNVEKDPYREFKGKNVLWVSASLKETAERFKKASDEIRSLLADAGLRLLEERAKRPALHLDDKILTDWNGLMIASFSRAARILDEPRYAAAATEAAGFILRRLQDTRGRLFHRYRDGEAGIDAHLEDYAFFIYGLLALYEATFGEKWLLEARRLADQMIDLFWDENEKAFFLTAKDAERLIIRPKQDNDGALPSGNSVAVHDLLILQRITGDTRYGRYAEETLRVFSGYLEDHPGAYSQMLSGLDLLIGPSFEIVIAADKKDASAEALLKEVFSRYFPNKVVLWHASSAAQAEVIEGLAPFTKKQIAIEGKPTVYVCRDYACELPVTDPAALKKLLTKK